MSNNITEQETSGATGTPLTTKSKVLETGASMVQVNRSSHLEFLLTPDCARHKELNSLLLFYLRRSESLQDLSPVKSICAHLNAFHIYADEPHRCVEANHYCAHINEGTPPHPHLALLFLNFTLPPLSVLFSFTKASPWRFSSPCLTIT